MRDPLPITRDVAIPLREVRLRVMRSTGPGGQHANVTASRVEAVFDVAGSSSLSPEQRRRVMGRVGPRLTAVAQDSRSQARNRDLALERLSRRLAAALAQPRVRHPTRPSAAARQRRMTAKRRVTERKSSRRPPTPDES